MKKMRELRIVPKDDKYVVEELEDKKNVIFFLGERQWIRWAERIDENFGNYIYGHEISPMIFDDIESCLDKIKRNVGIMNFHKTNVRIIL